MRNRKKLALRLISSLLVTVMVFTMVPASAFKKAAAEAPVDPYAIVYQKNGGTFAPEYEEPETVPTQQPVDLPAAGDITRPGHAFAGWYETADFTGDAIETIAPGRSEDVVLYARWDEQFYYVTIPEKANVSDGAAVSLAAGGLFAGDEVGVSVASENGWQLQTGTQALNYTLSTEENGAALVDNTSLLQYIKADTADRMSASQELFFHVADTARYAGNYEDTLIFTTTFIGVEYTITYNTGDGADIAPQNIRAGTRLNSLPTATRDNHLFEVWCYDSALTQPVADDDLLLGNLALYARYQEVQRPVATFLTSVARAMDQESDFCIPVVSSEPMTADEVKALLEIKNLNDESQTDILSVTGSDKAFTVAGRGGFEPGANYKLTLLDNRLSFAGQDPTLDEYNFSIKKEEVCNLSLSENVQNVPLSAIRNLIVNGAPSEELSIAVITLGTGENETAQGDTTVGSFTYTGAALTVGTTVAIYEGDEMPELDDAAVGDKVAFVEITAADGTEYTYRGATAEQVLFTPDVLPVPNDADTDGNPDNASITVAENVFSYTASFYAAIGLDADTTVDVGDYLSFYTGTLAADGTGTTAVAYAKIDSVVKQNDTYVIGYHIVSQEAMMEAMEVYRKQNVDGDRLLEGSDPALVERSVEQQAQESGFVQQAAAALSDLAVQTDSFKQIADEAGVSAEEFTTGAASQLKPASAPQLSMARIEAPASGVATAVAPKVEFKLTKVRASLGTRLQHFENISGLRLTLAIEVEITIHASASADIKITIAGSFEQEVRVGLNVSGKAIWKVWGIFPYIDDYKVTTSVDLYEYTGINIEARFTTASADGEDDNKNDLLGKQVDAIAGELKDLMEKGTTYISDDADFTQRLEDLGDDDDGGSDSSIGKTLGQRYAAMLETDSDWVEIYSKTLTEQHFRILLIIDIEFKIEFVISVNMNVTVGLDYWYENAKRYVFTLDVFAAKVTSDTTDLVEEHYELTLYVMGTAGIRAGVRLSVSVGIFSTKLASVGITAEVGAYFRIWGYFYYTLSYTASQGRSSNFSGAIYMELGIYLEIKFKADAFGGVFSYNPTLFEKEWPLLTIGERNSVVDFSYTQKDTKEIALKRFVTSKKLPADTFEMQYLDMKEGLDDGEYFEAQYDPSSKFAITITNPAFTFDPATGTINVEPGGKPEQDGELIITWRGTWSSVSKKPLQRRIPLHWDNLRDGYYIAFETGGGSNTDMIVARYNAPLTMPDNPVRQGYQFGGWYLDAACTNAFTAPATMPNTDTLLYAKWTPVRVAYMVEHYRQALNGTYELFETVPAEALTGLTVTAATKNYEGFVTPPNRQLTVTADGKASVAYYYARRSYTITFAPGESQNETITNTYRYGAALVPPTFGSKGYDFAGWNAQVPATVPADNMTFTARWTPSPATSYSVKYYLQNADDDGYTLAEIIYLNGATGASVTAPERTYANFSRRGVLPQTTIAADGTASMAVYYDRTYFTAVHVTNGGTVCANVTARHGSTFAQPTTTKKGYGFAGWYTDVALTKPFDNIMPVGGVTLYAKWEVGLCGYTVRHYQQNILDDGYTLKDSENFTAVVDTSATPAVKTYEGFTSPATQTIIMTVDDTLVVNYYYTRKSYSLTFTLNNGAATITNPVKYGAAITAPVPEKTGNRFVGWNATVPATMPAGALSFTAQWEVNTYTITLRPGNDTEDILLTAPYGSAVTAPENPTRTGYTFAGWSTAIPATMPAGNLTITAKWTPVSYSISYSLASGSATGSNPTRYTVESGVITVSNPVRTGYTFTGWTGTGLSSATKSLIIPTGSIGNRSYTANWRENTYTIKFQIYGQGATGSTASVTLRYSQQGTLTTNGFSRPGYTFTGWSTTAGGSKEYGQGHIIATLCAQDGGTLTLYPVWRANTYTVVFDGNGASGGSMPSQSITYDVSTRLSNIGYTRRGWTFLGWSDSRTGTVLFTDGAYVTSLVTGGTKTLYAQWSFTDKTISLSRIGSDYVNDEDDEQIKYHYSVNDYVNQADIETYCTKMTVTISFKATEIDKGYQEMMFSYRQNGVWLYPFKKTDYEAAGTDKGSQTFTETFTVNTANFDMFCLTFGANGSGEDDWTVSNVKFSIVFS